MTSAQVMDSDTLAEMLDRIIASGSYQISPEIRSHAEEVIAHILSVLDPDGTRPSSRNSLGGMAKLLAGQENCLEILLTSRALQELGLADSDIHTLAQDICNQLVGTGVWVVGRLSDHGIPILSFSTIPPTR